MSFLLVILLKTRWTSLEAASFTANTFASELTAVMPIASGDDAIPTAVATGTAVLATPRAMVKAEKVSKSSTISGNFSFNSLQTPSNDKFITTLVVPLYKSGHHHAGYYNIKTQYNGRKKLDRSIR